MTELLFIRHGPTEWNETGRIQGRADIPLSEAGRKKVCSWTLPPSFQSWACFCSPLVRARETATLLGFDTPQIVNDLREMHWGDWEGQTLNTLRAIDPEAFRRNEDRGLNFRPPNGESPRDVKVRLARWVASFSEEALPAVVVCHKGVLRAALSLATGWDMFDDPPEKLREPCAHLYTIQSDSLLVNQLNISLQATEIRQ
jgi:broad specificity phosphatase PhoE